MRLKIIIYLLLSISVYSYSQTKEETEEWINSKINIYPVKYTGNINIDEEILIDEGILYYYNALEGDSYYNGSWSKLDFKDIKAIKFSKDRAIEGGNSWIVLSFFFNENKAYTSGDIKQKYYPKSVTTYTKNPKHTRIQMRLDNRFKEDGIEKRMEKALLHLSKLYGGSATLKKEPF